MRGTSRRVTPRNGVAVCVPRKDRPVCVPGMCAMVFPGMVCVLGEPPVDRSGVCPRYVPVMPR